MDWDNKVIWSEGMFLRPQHFQQFDRYVEKLVRNRAGVLAPHPWGITEMQINRDLLVTGKFALINCRGVLEDGTPFSIPEDSEPPVPIDIPANTRNCTVYLALPLRRPGAVEALLREEGESVARYAGQEFDAADGVAGSESVARVRVGKLRLRYLLDTDERNGYSCLGLARIVEVRADKNITLDTQYIPPALDCAAVPSLRGFLEEVQGLLHHRGEALAGRLSQGGTQGVAEIQDFLLLQLVNRYEPAYAHLATGAGIHPERFYQIALELAGELSTFMAKSRRPPNFPIYKHEDLQKCFAAVMGSIRMSLSAVLEQNAIQIPLQERRYGIRVGPISDRSLLTEAIFVLAVRAQMEAEQLRRHFPNQVKIGPVEQIRELVNVALPGIRVTPLQVAPRQLPYKGGTTYFELDRSSSFWKGLSTSGGFAIFLAGEFPGLDMELWAIRG